MYSRKKANIVKIMKPNMPAIKTLYNFGGDTGEVEDVGSLMILV
jgi:hypothetical protein